MPLLGLVVFVGCQNGQVVTPPKSTSLSNTTWIHTNEFFGFKEVYKFFDDSRVSVESVLPDGFFDGLPGYGSPSVPTTYSYRVSGNKISITGSEGTEVYTMSRDGSYFNQGENRYYRSSGRSTDTKSKSSEPCTGRGDRTCLGTVENNIRNTGGDVLQSDWLGNGVGYYRYLKYHNGRNYEVESIVTYDCDCKVIDIDTDILQSF